MTAEPGGPSAADGALALSSKAAEDAHDIFVSYSRVDRPFVVKLTEAMQKVGYPVWWDSALNAGDDFNAQIGTALDSAKCVVVVWSEKSIKSRWVRDEADAGLQRGILVPIRIQGVYAPLGFRQVHDVDFSDWRGEVDEEPFVALVAGLKSVIGREPTVAVAPRPKRSNAKLFAALAIVLVAAIAGGFFWWQKSPSGPDFVRYANEGYVDPPLSVGEAPNPEACEALCRSDAKCNAYSHLPSGSCYLLASGEQRRPRQNVHSGERQKGK